MVLVARLGSFGMRSVVVEMQEMVARGYERQMEEKMILKTREFKGRVIELRFLSLMVPVGV